MNHERILLSATKYVTGWSIQGEPSLLTLRMDGWMSRWPVSIPPGVCAPPAADVVFFTVGQLSFTLIHGIIAPRRAQSGAGTTHFVA